MIIRDRHLILGLLLATLFSIVSGCNSEKKVTPDVHEIEKHQNKNSDNKLPDVGEPATPVYVPRASFDETAVDWPRLEVYVHSEGAYYYVSVEPDLAVRIDEELAEGKEGELDRTDDILGYATASPDSIHPQIAFSSGIDSWKLLAQNGNGEFFLGNILVSTDVGDALMERVREVTGWQLEGNPIKVYGITEIAIYLGTECVETITDEGRIADFEEYLHHDLAPSVLPKTADYHIEISCRLKDGKTVSFVTDANPEYAGMWVPPCYFYVCKGATEGVLEALGLDNWPEKILELELMHEIYPYPREIIDQLFERVGGQIALS